MWTYSLEAVWNGLQDCYAALAADVQQRYGVDLSGRGTRCVRDDARLSGLRCRRRAAHAVPHVAQHQYRRGGRAVECGVRAQHPHRWSIAHLYQAILNGEDHVGRLAHLTTLGGYVHWQLTGEKVLGVGDASGMFPIDVSTGGYDATMLARFDRLAAEAGADLTLAGLLPAIKVAGQPAGRLTEAGAAARPDGSAAAGSPAVPARGRRRYGDGRHQLGRAAYRQRLGRHEHLRDGRARAAARACAPGIGPGHHPGGRPGRDGALQ